MYILKYRKMFLFCNIDRTLKFVFVSFRKYLRWRNSWVDYSISRSFNDKTNSFEWDMEKWQQAIAWIFRRKFTSFLLCYRIDLSFIWHTFKCITRKFPIYSVKFLHFIHLSSGFLLCHTKKKCSTILSTL